jgi:hypothetical protein
LGDSSKPKVIFASSFESALGYSCLLPTINLVAGETQKEIQLHVGGLDAPASSKKEPSAAEAAQIRVKTSRYHRRSYQAGKRAMDIVLTSIVLLLIFPIFLVIGLILVISDGVPVVGISFGSPA